MTNINGIATAIIIVLIMFLLVFGRIFDFIYREDAKKSIAQIGLVAFLLSIIGKNFFDQYSLLHFAAGIIAYFWNISIINWTIIHVLFEYVENTEIGMKMINSFPLWPGGKSKPDTLMNSTGDNFFAIVGWLSAFYVDKIGNEYGLYDKHIKNP